MTSTFTSAYGDTPIIRLLLMKCHGGVAHKVIESKVRQSRKLQTYYVPEIGDICCAPRENTRNIVQAQDMPYLLHDKSRIDVIVDPHVNLFGRVTFEKYIEDLEGKKIICTSGELMDGTSFDTKETLHEMFDRLSKLGLSGDVTKIAYQGMTTEILKEPMFVVTVKYMYTASANGLSSSGFKLKQKKFSNYHKI